MRCVSTITFLGLVIGAHTGWPWCEELIAISWKHAKESAMCKWGSVQVAVRAIHDALLIHGHIGYSKEYPLEQRLRDTIGFEIGDGTAEIMKIIICRELLGEGVLALLNLFRAELGWTMTLRLEV